MSKLIFAIGFSFVLLLSFFYGLFSQSSPFMIFGFCLWTPAMLAVGYFAAANGVRLVVGNEIPVQTQNGNLPPQMQMRSSRIRQPKPERQ